MLFCCGKILNFCVCVLEVCMICCFVCLCRLKTMSDHQDQAEDVGLLTPHDQSEPSKDDDMHFRQVMT